MKKMIIIIMVVLTLEGYEKEARASLAKRYFPLNVGNSWTYTNYFVEPNDPNEPPPPGGPPIPPIVEFTFTIIGTEEIDGHTYYIFNDYFNIYPPPPTFPPVPVSDSPVTVGGEILFRYDLAADKVLMHWAGEVVGRYDFTGEEWDPGGAFGWSRLKQVGVACNVPAGEFSDCINFQFDKVYCGPNVNEPDAYAHGEYLAPNVGNIKFVRPGGNFLGLHEGQDVTFMLKSYTIIPEPAIKTMVDLDPDVFEVKVEAHKKPKKPKEEFLRAFIKLPADVNVADVNAATVNLCLNDTILAAAESPLIVDNTLDVLFRLDLENVGAILGLEVTKVKVGNCRIEVTATAAPSQPIDLIELTVSGDLLYPGSFTGTDAVRVMPVNNEG